MTDIQAPMGLLAELTHRCPLQCPYCSNPLELERAGVELDTETWCGVFDQAAALGVLQLHLSGGEPTVRRDLPTLVRHAAEQQLYTNLITSGVLLDERLMTSLVDAGLEHVQLSFQDTIATNADRIAGLDHAHERKLRAAAIVKSGGLPLTLNFVVHRQNLDRLEAMLALAVELGAGRIEIAHVQYYGWALANRAAFLPSRAQLDAANAVVDAARERLRGVLAIDYVPPDYYAHRPKACMAGWGRRFLNITPSGKVLPCHAAETLTGIEFPSVRDLPLAEIWHDAPAFQLYRGTDWMAEPCRSCDRREIDWGGCRCQAFALTGDAGRTDPACALSPDHALLDVALVEAEAPPGPFTYRRIGAASLAAR